MLENHGDTIGTYGKHVERYGNMFKKNMVKPWENNNGNM